MGYLQFYYGGEDNKTFRELGTKVDYYVSSRNFVKLSEYLNSNSDIKKYINTFLGTAGNDIMALTYGDPYVKSGSDYVLVTEAYSNLTTYYVEIGTQKTDCGACSNNGYIEYDDHTGSVTCPVCQGKGYRVMDTQGARIVSINFTQSTLTAGGYTLKYGIVPYESTKTIFVDESLVDDHTLRPEEIVQLYGD